MTGVQTCALPISPQRGQGLFVAKTYMAKMGGTVTAENVAGGVRIVLTLPRVTA